MFWVFLKGAVVSAAAASQHEDHEYGSLWEGFGLVLG